MSASSRLSVWLDAMEVAHLEGTRNGLRMTYDEQATTDYPLNTPLVSVAMPTSVRPYGNKIAHPFFDGLLPEGEARAIIAYDREVNATDTFAMLEAIGRECAGALVIQPTDCSPPVMAQRDLAEPLDTEQLVEAIRTLKTHPLGANGRTRISLGGMQDKLLLTKMSDGGWGRPVEGSASTHIVKPGPVQLPGAVDNEAFCLSVAKSLGLPAAEVDITEIAGLRVLVITRFDRVVHEDGSIERIHQEDFCQALGYLGVRKYQSEGGPSLRKCAACIHRWNHEDAQLELLLRYSTVNVLLGNADAHAKNLSLVHPRPEEVRLAPMYDVMSTTVYPGVDTTLGMFIGKARSVGEVTTAALVAEATSWGMSTDRAEGTIRRVLGDMPAAIEEATLMFPGIPKEVLTQVNYRIASWARAGGNSSNRPTPSSSIESYPPV